MTLPVPIFEVSPLLDHKEIDNYQRIFENGNEDFIHRYFNKDYFIPVLSAESKDEVLKTMCDLAQSFESLPDDYFDLVMKREEMGQTDFGNLVAIPHAYKVVGRNKFVVASILEKPIWWGHNEVQVVFLISLTGEDDEDVQQLYKVIMNYLSNIDLVMSTIKNPSFDNLILQLKEAGRR
jgi:lichenan operon transcriptional antiterminator